VPGLGKRDDFIGAWNGYIQLAVEGESAMDGKTGVILLAAGTSRLYWLLRWESARAGKTAVILLTAGTSRLYRLLEWIDSIGC
jgi:hypothetical protein